jgi:hypothetical protein
LIDLSLIVVLTLIYFQLNGFMKVNHKYEHDKRSCSMLLTFSLMVLILLFKLSVFVTITLQANNEDRDHFFQIEICRDEIGIAKRVTLIIAFTIWYRFRLPSMILSSVIILIKQNDDCLQGLSKLDYLLKISIFQKFKDKNMDKNPFSV